MKVIIITQEDIFFLPQNIDKVCDVCEVVGIIIINSKSALKNKYKYFLELFGIKQFIKMALYTSMRIIQGIIDRISGFRLCNGHCSIKHVAIKRDIEIFKTNNINSQSSYNFITKKNPDLIISFSAPQIIKEPLLSYPKFGIINVHSSLLPNYRGCLPSFWYLFNNEKISGATVHYMSKNIDDGDIILQESIDISNCNTMFNLIKKTKQLGGDLIIQVIKNIEMGIAERHKNNIEDGKYFSWPNKEQGREFLKKGKKLI